MSVGSSAPPRVSVVTVIHDSAIDLRALLGSLAHQLEPSAVETIVVDTGSSDGGAELGPEPTHQRGGQGLQHRHPGTAATKLARS